MVGTYREGNPPRLVLRFALLTALALALAAAAILAFVRHYNTVQAERAATDHVRFVADAILAHSLEPVDFVEPVDASRRAELDRLFEDEILVEGTLLAQLFSADGTVTYATDHELIGSRSTDPVPIHEAASGTIRSDVTSAKGERWAGTADRVLRAFAPVPLVRGDDPGVVVIVQDYDPIAASVSAAFFPVAGVLEVMLVLLFVTLVPILAKVSSRIRRQMAHIEYQAFHDHLTGLPNRAYFRKSIDSAIDDARERDESFAVMLLDLDRFKEVNDTLGHQSGDLLLQRVAERLRDVVADDALLSRLGGDEFGVLVPRASEERILLVISRLQDEFDRPFDLPELSVVVETSVGVSIHPDHGNDADHLIRRADIAMYVAKESHLAHSIYRPERDVNDPKRLALLGELRRAMEERELVLYFQPKLELASGRVCGAEALIRWQHPDRGLLTPADFIPFAERTGLVRPLSRYVLEAAARQCHEWSLEGTRLQVSVNLSMHDLLDVELPSEIAEILNRWDLDPSQLELEITEGAIMADPERVSDVVAQISDLGVEFAIDDFGTGYSSLAYLKRLTVNTLKVDKSFVLGMNDESDLTIVRSTVDLGHNLGLAVVAEGVETQEHWDVLVSMGCDYAQGYLVSPPVPAEEFRALLPGHRDLETIARR